MKIWNNGVQCIIHESLNKYSMFTENKLAKPNTLTHKWTILQTKLYKIYMLNGVLW